MKKLILSGLMLMALSFNVNAQEISNHALGLRFGGSGDGTGTEISYQKGLSDINRLEVDLGWNNNNNDNYSSVKLTGLYQWVWETGIEDGFNWYAGAGAGLGSYSHGNDYTGLEDDNDGVYFTLAGDAGIEYLFDFPLQLALDLRPELFFGGGTTNNAHFNFALSARYRFN